MGRLTVSQFKEQLRGGSVPSVCVFLGEDDYLIQQCRTALREAVERDDAPGSSSRVFAGTAAPREVLDELRTLPFMGLEGRRVAIVEDAGQFIEANRALLEDYLSHPADTGVLALMCEQLDGRTRLAKLIAEQGDIIDCSPLRWSQARSWIRRRAKALGLKMTPRAENTLIESTGPDLFALENELDKLREYCEDEPVVGERDVEALCPGSRERSVFNMGEAVARRDAARAFGLSDELMRRGESLPGIVAVLGRCLRQLWRMKQMQRQGRSAKEMATALGVPDFVVRKYSRFIDEVDEEWLAEGLQTLASADFESKNTSIQSHEEKTWLDALLTRLCA